MRSRLLPLALLGLALAGRAAASPVTIEGDHFVRDGKPHQIISGSVDYERIPREYWRDRLRKARAMGLNTITTYVIWNALEPRPGEFDFSGNHDVAAFVRLAQQEGLDVILRPGPYVCDEWDAGGYPAWLFADPHLHVRSQDPKYRAAAERYLMRVGRELAPLMAARGGPIIAVQVENEYGSFGDDRVYMEQVRQALVRAGLGQNLLFTSDGPDLLKNDALPGVLAVANFAPGEARGAFAALAKFRPGQPLMSGEYWAGWFDHWGGAHARTDAARQAEELAWMLGRGYSVNIYMFEGGTSFGFRNGANFQSAPDDHYAPQTSGYDYDAALDEAGRPTPKFFRFREVIAKATGAAPPALPAPTGFMSLPAFELPEAAPLWDNLPAPIAADLPQPMEAYGQNEGYMLYRTRVVGPLKGQLYLGDVRDYAAVYLDRRAAGTVERRLKQAGLELEVPAGEHTLDVLVENTGRVNYGPRLVDGRSGLIDPPLLDGRELHGWQVFPLPMASPDQLRGWTTAAVPGPAFHRGHFRVERPADTYLDTRAFGKGFAWVDGRNLGRIWKIGPQHDLYAPGPWLRRGDNSVVVFDLETVAAPRMSGAERPRWDQAAAP